MNNELFTTVNGIKRLNQVVSPYNIWGNCARLEKDYFTLANGVEVDVNEAIFAFTKFSYEIDPKRMTDEIKAMEELRFIIPATELAIVYDDVDPGNNIPDAVGRTIVNKIKTMICEKYYKIIVRLGDNVSEFAETLNKIRSRAWYYGFSDPEKGMEALGCNETDYIYKSAKRIMDDIKSELYNTKIDYYDRREEAIYRITEMSEIITSSRPIRRSFMELIDEPVRYYNEWINESISLDCSKQTTYTREKVHVEVTADTVLITSIETGDVIYDLKIDDDFCIDNQMRNWEVINDKGTIKFVKYRNSGKIMEEVVPKTGDWLMARTSGACRNGMFHKVKPIPLKVHFNDYEPEWRTDDMVDTGLTVNGHSVYKQSDRFDTQHYIKFDGLMQRVSTYYQSKALSEGPKDQERWIWWFDKADWKSPDGKYALVGRQLYVKGK